MRKIIVRIIAVLIAALVLVIVLNWSLVKQVATFSPIILPNFGAAPTDEAKARLQDIEYLSRLLKYDRSFDETGRIEFEQFIADGKQEVETMNLAELYLLAAKATALANNGHTGINIWPVRAEFNSVGVRYFYFQDGLYVVRTVAEYEQLIGGRVTEIDGQPIETIFATLSAYFGGRVEWRRLNAVVLLESPELLHAADLVTSPSGYTLTVVDQAGAALQIDLIAQMPQALESIPFPNAIKTLDAQAWPVERDEWVHSLQGVSVDDLPLYLQRIEQRFMWQPVQNGGGYVRLQSMLNTNEQSISEFFAENIKPLPESSLSYLVVDLRANDGGDFTLFVEIAKWLPGKVADDGHLYIVVGPQTFSAAIDSAALLKYYGGEKSIIIGEPMGDSEQYWGERGLPFTLPNSGFGIGYATGYHDWANGCEDHPYCHTQFLKHGVAAGSLAPSHILKPSYADYAAGRDVVMDWVYQQELP